MKCDRLFGMDIFFNGGTVMFELIVKGVRFKSSSSNVYSRVFKK